VEEMGWWVEFCLGIVRLAERHARAGGKLVKGTKWGGSGRHRDRRVVGGDAVSGEGESVLHGTNAEDARGALGGLLG